MIDEEERSLSLADERIEQAIMKTGAKLFILDPLQAYLGGSDMHSVNGIRPLMKSHAGVAERTGCAIVIIGHRNKKGGKVQYRGLGSIDIYTAARSVITVSRIGLDKNMRAVVHGKSNLAQPGTSLAFGFDDTDGFCWLVEYEITLLQKHIGAYSKTRNTYKQYRESSWSKNFRTEHEPDILLHQAAKKHFDSLGLTKLPSMQSLRQEYATLTAEKKKLYQSYRDDKENMVALLNAKYNVDRLLGTDSAPERTQERSGSMH